jgi:hypothetical protein
VSWLLVLGYGYVQVRRVLLGRDPEQRPRAIVIAFIVVTTLYVYAVATAFELAENFRYRFLIEPLFMALTVTAAASFVRAVREKIASRMQQRPSLPLA